MILKALFYCSSSQNVVPEPAASMLPGKLLKEQIFDLHQGLLNQICWGMRPCNLCFDKNSS